MDFTSTNKRRHTLPSISFVDPAIVRFIEKASSSSSSCSAMIEEEDDVIVLLEEEEEEEEDDDQRTTITTLSLPQNLSYPPYKPPTNHLDTLWARQEKYDNLELRLLSLEVTKKRFEQRLQALEEQDNNRPILLHQKPPMKPDQQPTMHETHDDMMINNNSQYIELYNQHQILLASFSRIQAEFNEKEAIYKKQIQDLMEQKAAVLVEEEKEAAAAAAAAKEAAEQEIHQQQQVPQVPQQHQVPPPPQQIQVQQQQLHHQQVQPVHHYSNNYNQHSNHHHNNNNYSNHHSNHHHHNHYTPQSPHNQQEDCSYKEEDGYLIFDTTNMNGEIVHCKVKIPHPSMSLVSPPATRVNSPQYQIPPTPLPSSIIPKKKKGLNFNAPEWKT